MERKDRQIKWLILAVDLLLFIAGFAIILTHAAFPTDWDACQFVLGMDRFSPPDHQPQPPGYFFLISLAHLIKWFSGSNDISGHSSLVIASAIAGGLLIPAVRRLTIRFYPQRNYIAIGASLLALGAPARLFYGAQALSYTWEGLFAVILVSLALDLNSKGKQHPARIWFIWAAVWAVSVGFRPNLILFFLPLAVFLFLKRRWWENLVAAFVFTAITALWIIPTVIASGGFIRYIQAVRGHSEYFVSTGLGLDRLADNIYYLLGTPEAITGLNIIGWAIIAVLVLFFVRKNKIARSNYENQNNRVLLFVALPLLLFHSLIFYNLRYALLYLPILIPLLAWLASQAVTLLKPVLKMVSGKELNASKDSHIRLGWLLPAVIMIFSYYGFLAGSGSHSLSHIRSLERETRHVAEYVKDLGEPDSVTIIAGKRFRCWGAALDEYTTIYPMHALYSPDLNPRLAVMLNGNTVKGDFYLPDAPESESMHLPVTDEKSGRIIVLDEDAFANLLNPTGDWNSERITSRENLYWKRFDDDVVLVDNHRGIFLLSGQP